MMDTDLERTHAHYRRAARVTTVIVRDLSGDQAVMTVTARRNHDEITRTMQANAATIRHAASAVAHHYGVPSSGAHRWSTEAERS